MTTSYPRATRAVALVVALSLSACASRPIVQWQAPARTEAQPEQTLDYAYSYADTARAAYQKAIVDQLKESTDLSSALVAAGALTAALAMSSGVSRDAVAGVAVLGGTSYALGNMSLSRPRLLVYQAGVEAINCAKRAVSPFNVDVDDQAALVDELRALAEQRKTTEMARQALDYALAPFIKKGQLIADIVVTAQASISTAAAVQKEAGEAAVAGNGLVAATRRADKELVFAVDRIDASVVRGSLDTVPDLSAVPRIIAGLAGIYDQIAPNAGVGKRTTDGLASMAKAMAKAANAPGQNPGEAALTSATLDLNAATVTLSERLVDVNAHVAGRATSWSPDAFKDCGVADVVQPLKTLPATLEFTAGSEAISRSISISGGTKPYFVEFDGPAVAGITSKQPLPFDSRAEVAFAKDVKAPQALVLRVTDASSPTRMQTVAVTVTAAAAVAPATAASDVKTSVAPGPTVVAALIKHASKLIPDLPAGMRMRPKPSLKNSIVTVPMACDSTVQEADRPTKDTVVAALRKLVSPVTTDGLTIEPSAKNADATSCLRAP